MKDQKAIPEINPIAILGSVFAHAEKLRINRSHKLQIFSAMFLCLLFAQTASAEYLLTTVSSVGSNQNGLAYDSGKGEIFVTNSGSNTISVISDSVPLSVLEFPLGGIWY